MTATIDHEARTPAPDPVFIDHVTMTPDEVHDAFPQLVARLRERASIDPAALRSNDLAVLAHAVGWDSDDAEELIARVVGCRRSEASHLYNVLVSRRLLRPQYARSRVNEL